MASNTGFYTVAVYEAEAEEGGYWCEVLDLPGCVAQGETLDELRRNMAEAIAAYEETRGELGDTIEHPRARWTWTVPVEEAEAGLPAG